MKFAKAEYAHLFGVYCGHRWIADDSDGERNCFRRQRESLTSFAELCERVNPSIEPIKDPPDNFAAKDKLYLAYARPLGLENEELESLPEFWRGFHASASEALMVWDRKRKQLAS